METNNFSLKLNRLFDEQKKLDGKPYTPDEVQAGTQGRITPNHLLKLRDGRISDPDLVTMQALANFFKIDPNYFFESDALKLQQLLDERNSLVSQIAQRASELGPDEQLSVLFMVESIHQSKLPKT